MGNLNLVGQLSDDNDLLFGQLSQMEASSVSSVSGKQSSVQLMDGGSHGNNLIMGSAHAASSHVSDLKFKSTGNLAGMNTDINDNGGRKNNGGGNSSDSLGKSLLSSDKSGNLSSDPLDLLSDNRSLDDRSMDELLLKNSDLGSLNPNPLNNTTNLLDESSDNSSDDWTRSSRGNGNVKLLSDVTDGMLNVNDTLLDLFNDLLVLVNLLDVDRSGLRLLSDLDLESSNSLLSHNLLLEKLNNGSAEMVNELLFNNSWLSGPLQRMKGSRLNMGDASKGLTIDDDLFSDVVDLLSNSNNSLLNHGSLSNRGLLSLDHKLSHNNLELVNSLSVLTNLLSYFSNNSVLLWDEHSRFKDGSWTLDNVQGVSDLNDLFVDRNNLSLQNSDLLNDDRLLRGRSNKESLFQNSDLLDNNSLLVNKVGNLSSQSTNNLMFDLREFHLPESAFSSLEFMLLNLSDHGLCF